MNSVWSVFVLMYWFKISVGESKTCGNSAEGYFWRDYTGTIPSDAIPAGTDIEETTYIGQALHPGGELTPGAIERGKNHVFYEFGNESWSDEEDVKILCSQRPEQLVWIPVLVKHSIFNINGTRLIIAGHDVKGPLTIGRKHINSKIVVGKVIIHATEFGDMRYATDAEHGTIPDTYEILAFNPDAAIHLNTCASKVVHINFYGEQSSILEE